MKRRARFNYGLDTIGTLGGAYYGNRRAVRAQEDGDANSNIALGTLGGAALGQAIGTGANAALVGGQQIAAGNRSMGIANVGGGVGGALGAILSERRRRQRRAQGYKDSAAANSGRFLAYNTLGSIAGSAPGLGMVANDNVRQERGFSYRKSTMSYFSDPSAVSYF